MKKYSMLGAAIRHPIKMFFLSILMMFVILIVSIILNINLGDDEISIIMIAGVISAAYILKRRCNKGSVDTPKPRRRKSLLFGMVKHMNNSVDQFGNALGNAFTDSFTGSSSRAADEAQYRAQQKQADAAARDAALRGKDKAARQYQNQADLWREKSRR